MVEKCVNLTIMTAPSNVVVEDFEVYLAGTTTPVSVLNIGEHFDMVVYVSNTGGIAHEVVIQVKHGETVIRGGTFEIGECPPESPLAITFDDEYFGAIGIYNLCGVASGNGITPTQDCKSIEAIAEYRLEVMEVPEILPSTVELGDPVSITVKYKNTGNILLPANKGRITLTANLANIDQRLIPGLAPGASGSYSVNWTAQAAGTYSICATVSYVGGE